MGFMPGNKLLIFDNRWRFTYAYICVVRHYSMDWPVRDLILYTERAVTICRNSEKNR